MATIPSGEIASRGPGPGLGHRGLVKRRWDDPLQAFLDVEAVGTHIPWRGVAQDRQQGQQGEASFVKRGLRGLTTIAIALGRFMMQSMP